MTQDNRPHGFQPVSYLNGAAWNGQARTYYVAQGNTDALWQGDVVAITPGASNGKAMGLISVGVQELEKAAADSVVRGVLVGVGMNTRELIGTIPATKQQSYLVEVVDDPQVIFEVQGDNTTTLGADVVGKYANFTVVNGQPGGVSGTVLETASIADDSSLPLLILGLAEGNFGAYTRFLVMFANHGLRGSSCPLTVETVVTATDPAFDLANWAVLEITAQAGDLDFDAPTGTGEAFQPWVICIKDDGNAQDITWDAAWVVVGVTLPLVTVAGKYLYVSGFYNATANKMHVLGVNQEA